MNHIPAYIAAEALRRLREDRRSSAQLALCMKRYQQSGAARLSPSQRVLQAEPVSAAIGLTALIDALITSAVGIGTAGTIAGISAGAIGGAIVTTGILVGASIASQALAPHPATPSARIDQGGGLPSLDVSAPANTPEVRYSTRQPIPAKRIIYGTAQVGGALFFEQVRAPYLFQGLLLCARPITSFKRVWIGANPLAFNSLDVNTTLTPLAVADQPNYPANLRVSLRLGLDSQTMDPILSGNFPDLDTNFRQRGIATAVFRYAFGADQEDFTNLWGQVARPNPLLLVEGVAVPDPRIASHIIDWNPSDPDSVSAAEATWAFSNNAALCQAHYMSQRFGGRILPQRMDWDKVAAAADYDDELVGCADGGFIKRHTIDGVIALNQRPFDVITSMLTANRGFVLESAGRVWVSSSAPRDPVLTIHDGILCGGIQFDAAKPKRQLLNRIKSQFVASEREYQIVDGPILSRTDLQTSDSEILEATLSLPFTLDHRRVQRLQKASLEASRIGASLTCRVDVGALAKAQDDLVGNAVIFDSELFPKANGTYLVLSHSFNQTFTQIELQLVQYNADIERDWIAADDEQEFSLSHLDVT